MPSTSPEPLAGRRYWRSLDELADTPAFREWVEREFPAGATEGADPMSRRNFMRLMSASCLLAGVGLTGCRRPVETIYPFAKAPENFAHGMPQYYATAMPARGIAQPLLAKSYDGRPIKVEGNAQHPVGQAGTDVYAQASILGLYDPDRAQRFTQNGTDTTAAAAADFLAQLAKQAAADGGKGLCFLMEQSSSPSRARLQAALAQKLSQARWFVYEPIDLDTTQTAATLAHGKPVRPFYRLEAARVILSLEADLIGAEADNQRLIRGFAQGRRPEKDGMGRLYCVESLLSLTGLNADHRLRVPASMVGQIAAVVAREVLRQGGAPAEFVSALDGCVEEPALKSLSQELKPGDGAWIGKWALECARDLVAAKGRGLVLAGHRQPLEVHLMALAINAALGSISGEGPLSFREELVAPASPLAELAQLLNAGAVKTLVVLGGNPVYNAPADLAWAQTQRKAQTVVRLGAYEDETFPVCDWHLPAAHYLESWGDGRSGDGTLVPIQPLIAPLFGGWTELEVLARIGGLEKTNPYEIVRETFRGLVTGGDNEWAWKKFLHDGYWANSATAAVTFKFDWAKAGAALRLVKPRPLPGPQNLEVVLARAYGLDDGRYNNNGWLQELPDPITKLTWDNAALMSRRTAQALGLKNEDRIEIKLGGQTVQAPVWVQPGMADHSLGLSLGYGRQRTGRVGQQTGYDAYPLRTSAGLVVVGATVRPTGQRYPLACTQNHWSMEGRSIVREGTYQQFHAQPDFVQRLNAEEAPSEQPLYPNPLDRLKLTALQQWGMAVDLNACVGCSACIIACQGENNIPIVGKEQVAKGREMHWIRLDRYYTADPVTEQDHHPIADDAAQTVETWIDNPQAVTQPMFCQHCEAAPCENVCPVNATVHNDEGLNLMVYNRCVGTRYCSNNCPYKVRRFNFFDFNKRPIGSHQLYLGPLAKRPADEFELMKLAKNPDVTVRMRGVMEKCTYCLQRIEQAKIAQKIKAGASGNVAVPEGALQTACQQACPAEAIVFGDVADPHSRVSQIKQQSRNYAVLGSLGVKPRTTYLARLRNPNPAMPDAYDMPMSTKEYVAYNGSLEASPEPHAHAAAEGEKGGR